MDSSSPPQTRIRAFKDFWPFYLSQHSASLTRRLHFTGTSIALVSFATLIMTQNPMWIFAALVGGYAPAWLAHFFIEHNRPATFRYPFFSLAADFKMWFLMLTRHKLM